jgi:hypothetical protein
MFWNSPVDAPIARASGLTAEELSGKVIPGASADWQTILPEGTALGDSDTRCRQTEATSCISYRVVCITAVHQCRRPAAEWRELPDLPCRMSAAPDARKVAVITGASQPPNMDFGDSDGAWESTGAHPGRTTDQRPNLAVTGRERTRREASSRCTPSVPGKEQTHAK